MTNLFNSKLSVINVGVSDFAKPIIGSDAKVINVDWTPPGNDENVARALGQLVNRSEVEEANHRSFQRYLDSQPTLVGVKPAFQVIEGMSEKTIMHSGPPITWEKMCSPMRGAIIGACIFEEWETDHKSAEKTLESGAINFIPCHHNRAVGPMAGIISPSMPVWIIDDPVHNSRYFSNLNEGLGKVLRFGANDSEVINRLHWMKEVLGPALGKSLEKMEPLKLKPLMAQALHMGDEVHNRNVAASALLLKRLITAALKTDIKVSVLSELVNFISNNDHFFLNLSMSACKAMMDAAHGIPGSSLVTAMARNGTDFGIRVSGLGDNWFKAPAPLIDGLFFPGFDASDANPDLGDSSITETAGVGAFAMAASPAIVQFVGGSAYDSIENTKLMSHITHSQNDAFTIPQMNFSATPACIDVRKVIDTSIMPIINTGIAHRKAGVGQIGAGITKAPADCFSQAVIALAKTFSN
ncbi:MAG: DUF1116 domain-containing protein [Alphaproteobacteria bacterium]|mgnify:CR=1 FL=1|nr:DUF1116 domain-containing protein [Alphaproteobacteria bacterium]|tara:strand:- start:101 stop:1504 length:1404 start_codon:yes stop_codon:yes gene_type:complete